MLSALLVYMLLLVHFESQSEDSNIKDVYDAVWYTVVTLTSVGYGVHYPTTPEGKVLGLVAVLGSLGVLSYVVSKISIKYSVYMENKKTGQFGTKFKDHFVIIGWDSFSKQVAKQIVRAGKKVAIVTNSKSEVEWIEDSFKKDEVFVLFADYNNYEMLAKTNIQHSLKVFVNFDDDANSLIHIINIKKVYPNLNFLVTLNSPDLKETFKSIGVIYIVSKNEIASKLVASYIFEPDAAFLTEDLMEASKNETEYDIAQYHVEKENPYLNKDYTDAFYDLKKEYNAVLIGIAKTKENYRLIKNPDTACEIEFGDYLIVMANSISKAKLEATFHVKDGRLE